MLRAVVRMATEVAAQPVRWLWTDHLALGKIAVVAGAPNVGKSLLVTGDFAARVSVGAAWPDGAPCPAGDVLITSGYDGAADTVVPRLLEHGADLRRVHFLEGFTRADADPCTNDAGPSGRGAHLLLTPGGVPLLDRALRRLPEVKLVVFDPVLAFLDGTGNGTRARHVLSALQALAERRGAAFVLVAGLREGAAKGRLAGPSFRKSAMNAAAAASRWATDRWPSSTSESKYPARSSRPASQRTLPSMISQAYPRDSPPRLFLAGMNSRRCSAVRSRATTHTCRAADTNTAGPATRGWAPITLQGKEAGHKAGTLERVRASVAETFKRKGQEGRWLWRLIGDDRTSSDGDIADFFGAGEIGLPNFDGPSFEPVPPLPAGAYDDDEDEDDEK